MSKLFNSFFGRLYGALFLAIVVSLFLTIFIIEQWDSQYSDQDFIEESVFFSSKLEQHRKTTGESPKHFYSSLISDLYPLTIRWIENSQGFCSSCTLFAEQDNSLFYELPDGRLALTVSLEGESGLLVIADLDEDSMHLRNEQLEIEDIAVPLLCFLIVVAAAIALYRPLSKLESNIRDLNQVAMKIGSGDLSARANLSAAPPLTQLVEQLNTMASALDNKFTESQVFAQAVPHELRTPLSRIQLATGLLRKQALSKDQVDLVNNIDNYIDDLDSLCSQIIQLSKLNMSTQSVARNTIRLSQFIDKRIQHLTLDDQLNLTVDCDPSIIIVASPVNLRLVLDNLINNAAKYARKNVTIFVKDKRQYTEIIVEDDGIGIPDNEKANVFIPFSRVDKSRNRQSGGLGLGLSITKSAILAMGGSIQVRDGHIAGTRFHVKLVREP